jgi:valyl-tRNA synthetase
MVTLSDTLWKHQVGICVNTQKSVTFCLSLSSPVRTECERGRNVARKLLASWQGLFREHEGTLSIHRAAWPIVHSAWIDPGAEEVGQALRELLRQVRRYKAEHGLSVGAEMGTLHISASSVLHEALKLSLVDLKRATRARSLVLLDNEEKTSASISDEAVLTLKV